MCRVDVQKSGQAPATASVCDPRVHRRRSCGRRDDLQQGSGQQRQTDAALKRRFRPGSEHLHGGGILSHREIGFHRQRCG